jgi:hypothetical protein
VTPPVPTHVPDDLIAGDSWQWDMSWSDYPASTWNATAYFRGIGLINVAAAEDGDTFEFRATPAETATVPAGVYRYFIKVTNGTDTFTVDQGAVEVLANAATATATELQTHAEKALALIEALIEGRVVDGKEAVAIFGRSWQNIPMEELRKLRAAYRGEVLRERYGGKLPSTEVVYRRA